MGRAGPPTRDDPSIAPGQCRQRNCTRAAYNGTTLCFEHLTAKRIQRLSTHHVWPCVECGKPVTTRGNRTIVRCLPCIKSRTNRPTLVFPPPTSQQ